MKVGIDLGTTNSALAWIDPADAEDTSFPPIHIFDIPQLIAPGRIEPRRTLPSFLYLDEGQPVGIYARNRGPSFPPGWCTAPSPGFRTPMWTDREDPAVGRGRGRPSLVARGSFRALPRAPCAKPGTAPAASRPLAEQDVVLTVPASFDEEARELTVKAAKEAGLTRLTLLEEPAAAFYSWIANNFARSRRLLFDGQVVLICDVGGGTSDFSLIRVAREGDKIDFTRTAVGKHLLLGGDNLDLTLAWLAETKLDSQLSIRQRSGLRRQCSAAKEILLCDPRRQSVEINVLGGGSSLIGGSSRPKSPARKRSNSRLTVFCRLRRWAKSRKRRNAACSANSGCRMYRPGHQPAPLGISRRAPIRSPTPSCSTEDSSSPKFCASAWRMCWRTGTASVLRYSRTAIWTLLSPAAPPTTLMCARRARECWCAEGSPLLLHRTERFLSCLPGSPRRRRGRYGGSGPRGHPVGGE